MNRSRKCCALMLGALLVMLCSHASLHPSSPSDWRSVEQFEGQKIEVLVTGGAVLIGILRDVSDSFLVLEAQGQHKQIDKTDVHRIYRIKPSTRAKKTVLGAGIGVLAAEVAAVALSDGDIELTGAGVVGAAVAGATLGAIVGLVTSAPEQREVIYEPRP